MKLGQSHNPHDRIVLRFMPAIVTVAIIFQAAASATIEEKKLKTGLVPSPAKYMVLLPPGYEDSNKVYPVFFWLHGGGGDNGFLKRNAAVFEALWETGETPDMVVVTPDADRSFYLDYRDGSQKWESFIVKELLPRIRRDYRVTKDKQYTFIGGISMGGMGSLRMGLKYTDIFGAIVAMEPGIEPAYAWKDVKPADKFWRSRELLEERFGTPFDEAYWAANNPATIARDEARRIVDSGIAIYIEVGSEDAFGLDRGTDFLHRTFYDNGIKHEYRYVLGADHVGITMDPRIRDGLRFLHRVMNPPGPDHRLELVRRRIEQWKKDAGLIE